MAPQKSLCWKTPSFTHPAKSMIWQGLCTPSRKGREKKRRETFSVKTLDSPLNFGNDGERESFRRIKARLPRETKPRARNDPFGGVFFCHREEARGRPRRSLFKSVRDYHRAIREEKSPFHELPKSRKDKRIKTIGGKISSSIGERPPYKPAK